MSKILSSSLYSHQVLAREVAEFYLSKAINPEYFNEIIQILCGVFTEETVQNQIKLGMFEPNYFQIYKQEKKVYSFIPTINSYTVELLKESRLLKDLEPFMNRKMYEANVKYAKWVHDMDLLDNILFGTKYIIERYRKSVFKIENTSMDDKVDIGTGFLIEIGGIYFIATNQHVIAKSKKIRLLDIDENEYEFSIFYADEEYDVAFLRINGNLSEFSQFKFSIEQEILSEIITIGYPSIPMAKEAYQVIHRGEINSHIENYQGKKLFLISAKTSSGNSGSPVINEQGVVLGMIAQELFEKGALLEKGKLPYIAVIPSEIIYNLLVNKLVQSAKPQ